MEKRYSDAINEKLEKLKNKYEAIGQNWENYLDGLLHADSLTYWEYINLDVLLSLQQPRTQFPDEYIFISYHQISELYLDLIIHELDQICNDSTITGEKMEKHIKRCNIYVDQIVNSFTIMIDGMDKDQFLAFRMALLPASGFQSSLFRKIEIISTPLINLVHYGSREENKNAELELKFKNLYWKKGATELATQKKTLTLKHFEQKYGEELMKMARKFIVKNLWVVYKGLSEAEQKSESLINAMREYDFGMNVAWPLEHYKSAVRYLDMKPAELSATGGTNWQEYLPPKNQRISYFPELWTDEEFEKWGKMKISF